MEHLAAEGLGDRSVLVGDVMTDVCLAVRDEVRRAPVDLPHGLEAGGFFLATLHRAENTDDPARLDALLEGLAELPVPVLLLAHPRLVRRAEAAGLDLGRGSLRTAPPAPYRELVSLALQSRGVVTDSGGLQKEAYLLRRPCATLRTETEWVETLEDAANVLVPDPAALRAAVGRQVPETAFAREHYGDGHAADRVVKEIVALVT
jgi:UDP-N-acetylglucosamine 2-epimerase (non-hydrolysing)